MSLRQYVTDVVTETVRGLFDVSVDVALSVPEEQFGDFATNVAMQLAGKVGKAPREIAEQICAALQEKGYESTVAGPGFINIHVTDEIYSHEVAQILEVQNAYGTNQKLAGQVIVTEYSDMNAFKTAHVGHLYTTIVGDVVSKLLEAQGATVKRTNFGGDVGLHVGKAMWAIMRYIDNDPSKLADVPVNERARWVSERYVEGNTAYEENEQHKAEVIACNKQAYAVQAQQDHESVFAQVYWTCREWSYDGFEQFYVRLEIYQPPEQKQHFIYYPESQTSPFGKKLVQDGLARGIFEHSDGAVVYKGEQDGLHTRVFLTTEGLPTYETKDLGLAVQKWQDFHYDRSIIITANDILVYMKVILAALKHFDPELSVRTTHLTHGLVKLAGGAKMSSRTGKVVTPDQIIEAATAANIEATGKDDQSAVLAAIKYAFLKQKLGGDIIYDAEESVNILGNSGPYLQYAHARACSILGKITAEKATYTLDPSEKSLVRKMAQFPDEVSAASEALMPHIVCTYLYELAQEFNRFYEKNRVVGDPREAMRAKLVRAYTVILRNGLELLGVQAPEKM